MSSDAPQSFSILSVVYWVSITECRYTECLSVAILNVIFTECHLLSVAILSVALLSVALLSVAPLSVALLSVAVLSVTKLSVFMLKVVVSNVVAPMEASSGLPVMKRKYLIKWRLRESCKVIPCFKNSAYPNKLDHFINVNIFFRHYEMAKLTVIHKSRMFLAWFIFKLTLFSKNILAMNKNVCHWQILKPFQE